MATLPGPKGHYLHGNQLEFDADPQTFLLESALEHGDHVRFRLGLRECFLISDLREAQRILTERHAFTDKRMSARASAYPRSVARVEGDGHLERRRMLEPAFRAGAIDACIEVTREETEAQIGAWSDGEVRPLFPEMARIVLRSLVRILLGEEGRRSIDDLEQSLQVAEAWMGGSPHLSEARFQEADATLRRCLIDAVVARKAAQPVEPPDLLQCLVGALEQRQIDEATLVDEVVMMLITRLPTAGALAWSWYHLVSSPEAWAKLEACPFTGRAGHPSSPAGSYVDSVVREALRLHPPVWTLARETVTDYESAGQVMRADRDVLISPYVIHRLPAYWDRAEEFVPERFIPGSADHAERPRLSWLPFGAGLRKCLGQRLTLLMMKEVITTIAPRFRFALLEGYLPSRPGVASLRPGEGLPVRVHARSS